MENRPMADPTFQILLQQPQPGAPWAWSIERIDWPSGRTKVVRDGVKAHPTAAEAAADAESWLPIEIAEAAKKARAG
jgi:hypothetical protein